MTNVAKTRGRGRGVYFLFQFFASVFAFILLYCYFRMIEIWPSFMMEISEKNNRSSEPDTFDGFLKFETSWFVIV